MKNRYLKLIVFIITATFLFSCFNQKNNQKIYVRPTTEKQAIRLNFEQLVTKINDEDSFIAYVGLDDCGACKAFKPHLDSFIDETASEVFYLEMNQIGKTKIEGLLPKTTKTTPSFFVVKEAKVIKQTYDVLASVEKIKEFLKDVAVLPQYKAISYDELIVQKASSTKTMVYIGRKTCRDCQTFEPHLYKYLETKPQNNKFKYFEVVKYHEDGSLDNLQEELKFDWTPTFNVYQNDDVVSKFRFLDSNYWTENLTIDEGSIDSLRGKTFNSKNDKQAKMIEEYMKAFDIWIEANK